MLKLKQGTQIAIGITIGLLCHVLGNNSMLSIIPIFGLFNSWAVMQHECLHGLAAYLTGGGISTINLYWKAGGNIQTSGGFYPLISLAGYMGTSAYAGSLLYASTKKHGWIYFVGTQLVLQFILVVNAYTSLLAWLAMSISCLFIFTTYVGSKHNFSAIVLSFITSLLFWSSISDIQVLTSAVVYQSDAYLLAQYFGISLLMWPIAVVHVLFTIVVWIYSSKLAFQSVVKH